MLKHTCSLLHKAPTAQTQSKGPVQTQLAEVTPVTLPAWEWKQQQHQNFKPNKN